MAAVRGRKPRSRTVASDSGRPSMCLSACSMLAKRFLDQRSVYHGHGARVQSTQKSIRLTRSPAPRDRRRWRRRAGRPPPAVPATWRWGASSSLRMAPCPPPARRRGHTAAGASAWSSSRTSVGVALFEGIGDMFREDRAEHDLPGHGGIHDASQRIRQRPEVGLVADGATVGGRRSGVERRFPRLSAGECPTSSRPVVRTKMSRQPPDRDGFRPMRAGPAGGHPRPRGGLPENGAGTEYTAGAPLSVPVHGMFLPPRAAERVQEMRKPLISLVLPRGIEPPTPSLPKACSRFLRASKGYLAS